jgi:phage tail-like protein
MATPREPLYQRLPEIYRIRDVDQQPPGQLEAFVGVIDEVSRTLRDDIEALYHDFFIETCNPWAIPYIADLLGTSHLAGDPHDLRADVARTVRHRRRKGTLGAIESLVHALSGWAVRAVEMRDRLFWAQHLNHQRPDAGGVPPLSLLTSINAAARGGTVTLRDPALLSSLDGPFDPFAHSIDLKPPRAGLAGFNLPNLAIFLWRLTTYQPPVSKPVFRGITDLRPVPNGLAAFSARFDLHPLGEPMVLFNAHRYRADSDPPNLASEDAVPGPMPPARLTQDTPTGRPDAYVHVTLYDGPRPDAPSADETGPVLHVSRAPFATTTWRLRGANLCAWEAGLQPALREHEIVVDPERGRLVLGVAGANPAAEAEPLRDHLLVSARYGFSGPTGAHPIGRASAPAQWQDQAPILRIVDFHADPAALRKALDGLPALSSPLIVEIRDSMTHDLDLALVTDIGSEGGKPVLRLSSPLWIRAAAGQRPVIRLAQPLAFRPHDVLGPHAAAKMASLTVRLEGLYLTRGAAFGPDAALIERAALNQLQVTGCTLDPSGFIRLDGTRAPLRAAMCLTGDYGFTNAAERERFDQTPVLAVEQSIAGSLAIDAGYQLRLARSIVDAGSGIEVRPAALAVRAASGDPEVEWGPELMVDGITCFGRMRVFRATGQGGIWCGRLEVHDNQAGCVRFSYFSGDHDRLPQNHGCIFGPAARLRFVAEAFGAAGYGQLTTCTDERIREQGPAADEMGAFGFLMSAHKGKNIGIRLREFMPIGVRPVLIPVT